MIKISILSIAAGVLLALANPQIATAQGANQVEVTCKSSAPTGGPYAFLKHRSLADGRIEYYGRYKLWSPIGNPDCRIRQFVFNVGRLAHDLPAGAANGPVLTYIVQHGIFHCEAKDMKVDPNMGINANGPDLVEYTVNAQAEKPKRGIYYAKISVVGLPPSK